MRKFKIKNRRKRKYTKRSLFFSSVIFVKPVIDLDREEEINFDQSIETKILKSAKLATTKSVNIKHVNYMFIPYILIFIAILSSVILFQNYATKFVISDISIRTYFSFGYLYHEALIVLAQIGDSVRASIQVLVISIYNSLLFEIKALNQTILIAQAITSENDKKLYKIIFTIIYTINFTNFWLIGQVAFFIQVIGYSVYSRWEKLIEVFYTKMILSGKELDRLSPLINFIFDELHRSAQGLLSNMYNILKFLSKKSTVDV